MTVQCTASTVQVYMRLGANYLFNFTVDITIYLEKWYGKTHKYDCSWQPYC